MSRIVRVFGVDEPTAQALLAALPAMVCQAVNQARAAHFARALVSIGARLEVRNRAGELVEVAELLEGVRDSREVRAERAQPENDNDVAAPVRGSAALADTLGATPTPAPQALDTETLQHAPTAPRIAPEPGPGWGELQREPQRARPPSQPLAAVREQLSRELLVPQAPAGAGPREFAAQDSDQRLSLEPQPRAPARAGGQPLTAAGQHPAMRGMSRPLSGQLTQPLTAAEFVGRARAPSGKLVKDAEPAAPPAPVEQANDWSDVGLPERAASAAADDTSSWMLGNAPEADGPSTTGQDPRLHTDALSGPALSLDPGAVRAVASRAGVAYEAAPGRARKPGADDAARAAAPRARADSAKLAGGAGRAPDAATVRAGASRAREAPAGLRASVDRVSAHGDEDPAVQRGSAAGGRGAGRRSRDDSAVARAGDRAARAVDAAAPALDNAAANGGGAARAAASVRRGPRDADDDSDFWDSFTETLAFPFRGSGIAWLVSLGIWAICASVLTVLAVTAPVAGLTVMFFGNSSVLALCADYHRHCMWAVANHDGMLVRGPEFDPTHIMQEYVRGGVHVTGFAALCQLPLALWLAFALGHDGQRLLDLTFSVRFWALAALPSLYWPMAMATASLYNRGSGVWFVPVGIRAIVRAPLMYFAVFAAGALTFVVPWFVLAAVAREAGIPGSLMLAIAGFPLAASHGVMGALTGLLMRSKPNLFA